MESFQQKKWHHSKLDSESQLVNGNAICQL